VRKVEPQREHQWLQQLVGAWDYEVECIMGPGEPPSRTKGSETVRSLGGLWIIAEGQGEMPGGGLATTIMTVGYDPRRMAFVGTWIGSMMAHLWIYDGRLDSAGKVLTLDAEGPSFAEGGTPTAQYRDAIEIRSDGHRIPTSRVLGDDGTWNQFMTANYRRRQ
jgi:hypothetical protein